MDHLQESVSDSSRDRKLRLSVELPPIQQQIHQQIHNADITSEPLPGLNSARHRDLLPSIMTSPPPGPARSSTLPPLQRHLDLGTQRQGRQPVTKRSKDSQHRKHKSRDMKDWGKIDIAGDLLRPTLGQERPRPSSAEPSARSPWNDLLEAATSRREIDMNEDRASVSLFIRTAVSCLLT